jgi:hypothetical protein
VLAKQERFSDAVLELRKAAELDPSCPEAHLTLANVHRQTSRKELADGELSTIQKLKQAQKNRDHSADSGQAGDRPPNESGMCRSDSVRVCRPFTMTIRGV